MARTWPRRGNRVVVAGATLIAAAVMLGIVGTTLEAVAVTSAIRRRIGPMEVPMPVLAKHHWRRSRGALDAAVEAWRKQPVPRMSDTADGAGIGPSTAAIRERVGV
jgi:DNA-binding transcriptional LysR family regulator